ncbi:hypothetical protein [Nostoc sp. DSM 114167]|uniref:hypothetical protein n=1 Tax=Nostoc sp. DSM 114167 TaxID=3439050 RepID=UPI0040463AA8
MAKQPYSRPRKLPQLYPHLAFCENARTSLVGCLSQKVSCIPASLRSPLLALLARQVWSGELEI